MDGTVTVEICVEGPDGAAAASTGGADRVELCAALAVGGVTPSAGTIESVRRRFAGELTVLVRPRPGDFRATPAEVEAILADVDAAIAAGADGVTVGVLRDDGTVDLDAIAAVVERAGGRPVTFHRALDVCVDPIAALEVLAEAGVARVLSSGGAPTAAAGAGMLRRLVERAGDRLVVQAAAGIRSGNVGTLIAATGARAVHASASSPADDGDAAEDRLGFGRRRLTDPDEVRALVEAVRAGA
ncbi:MAG: copper homeostasis protein CutC [Planctomycetota bacterium JB042]